MITSPKNSRIKEAQKLHRRRYRYKNSRFVLEGARLIEDALLTGARPEVLFFASDAHTSNAKVKAIVEQTMALGVECIECSTAAFAALAETTTPQGVAAIFPLPSFMLPSQPTLSLILDRVRDPGNAGTLLRSAEAAGVDQVLFAPKTVDPYNEKVVRAAMGAHFRLPICICETWEAVHQSLAPNQQIYVAEANAELAYDQVDWNKSAALIVGGEATGPSSEAMDGSSDTTARLARQKSTSEPIAISIPMLGSTESLNAGVSGAIILFEAARQRRI